MASDFPITARTAINELQGSQIREVANAGIGMPDVLAFWFGEPDAVTPEFIRQAAIDSLRAGETFYTSNLGIPALREAISQYVGNLHQRIEMDRVAVTSSGVSALKIAAQALMGPDDRVVIITPVWPNLTEAPRILGAHVIRAALECIDGRWRLDVDRLLALLTPDTRVLVVNSPNNPTGWVIEPDQIRAVLEHCRRHGIWIVSDDVYERLIYEGSARAAPSFLDIAAPEDRVISTNSFSKSWLMTGWRLGWMVSPRGKDGRTLLGDFGKLIEYNTSCAPSFVQQGALAALINGEAVIDATRKRYGHARDLLCSRLSALPGITIAPPAGAMYAFFKIDGVTDSLALCKDLVQHAGLGLAPGAAFGPEGEGFVRWCFASTLARLEEGVDRLENYLSAGRAFGSARPTRTERVA